MMRSVCLLLLALCFVPAYAQDFDDYLRYEEFLEEVRSGNIVSVTLDEYSALKGVRNLAGEERPFHTYGDTGNANDPLLLDLLREHAVAIEFDRRRDDDFMGGFGFMGIFGLMDIVLPIATLLMIFHVSSQLNTLGRSVHLLEARAIDTSKSKE